MASLLVVFVAGCGQETVTIPSVVSSTPAQGATDVVINTAINATFSIPMNPASINATTFSVTNSGGAVAGTVTYSGTTATFTPSANLAYGALYTATITTGATGLGGTPLIASYVWTFTPITPPPLITAAPTVAITSPVSSPENMNVPLNQLISATFSEPMNSASIISANFTLTGPGTTSVSGLVNYAAIGNELVFEPSGNLQPNTTYTATITTGVENAADQPLANKYVWTFETGTTLNTTSPELVSTVPGDTAPAVQAINVPLNQAVNATFNEAMNPLTLTTATFLLYPGTAVSGTPIAGAVSYNATTFIATFTPTAPLTANSSYTATVSGAMDLAGNTLGTIVPSPFSNPWTFKTGTALIQPPVVLGPTIAQFGGLGGGAGMTNQGLHTVINNGGIATTGASSLITGFHDTTLPIVGAVWPCTYTETPQNSGQVNGVIDTATPPPTINCPNEGTAHTMAVATEAALEARIAYTTLQGLPTTGVLAAELGGTTIYPGVYKNASSVGITLGNLTLDAQGNPNASWVFQIGSSLTVGTPTSAESVILINGAQAGNVFWAVGGLPGTIINYGGGGTMVGTIISQPGITVSSPGQSTSSTVTTINGRVLALDASTTMVNTVINVP
ncbi:MAG: Ig-like domain-containing protein [Terracidiphilus sp.]